ncbi:MAG: LysR family transcriptional regulator [Paracoccus sp. (in: a-proteobacteria)]
MLRRHESFTRAARETNVTQPAINRRIRSIETGSAAETVRSGGETHGLTPEGRQLMETLRLSLSQIEATILELQRQSD